MLRDLFLKKTLFQIQFSDTVFVITNTVFQCIFILYISFPYNRLVLNIEKNILSRKEIEAVLLRVV